MKQLLDLAKQKGFEAEIYKTTSTSTTVDVRDKEVESTDTVSETGLSIRVLKDQKLGFAYTTDIDEDSLPDLLEEAINSSKHTKEDPYFTLPEPADYPEVVTYDEDIYRLNIKEKTELAKTAEVSAYAHDKRIKKTEKITFFDSETKVEILNSKGINLDYLANSCGLMSDVIAIDGNDEQSGTEIRVVSKFKELDAKNIGILSAKHACELLNAKTITPQSLPLLFDQNVSANLLGAMANLFSSDSVQKGKSLFAGKIGQAVASGVLTIIDDGKLEGGIMSSPFDDEGSAAQKTVLIENGSLKNYLYNAYTAKKEGKISTGNGRRASYKSLPEVSATNLYIKPGILKGEQLIAKIKKGIFITRVMGMHTVNPISGDFSIGAAGVFIENGKLAYPVRQITIAGNLIDLLKSIEEVGSDLVFYPLSGNLGSPTLLAPNIAVSA